MTALLSVCLSLFFCAACSDNDLDSLQGTYNNIVRYTFTQADVQPTVKKDKDIKVLNVNFTDAAGDKAALSFGSKEWRLTAGSYTGVASVSAIEQMNGTVGGKTVSGGSVDVNIIGSIYYLNGLLTLADGSRCVVNYRGPLAFVVDTDVHEAGGN